MDFGLYFFHNAQRLLDRGTAPYFYLPKMEHHLEARLWNDVFTFAQEALGIPHGHDPRHGADRDAARPRSRWTRSSSSCATTRYGLNAGRWDYIFSMIKCFRDEPDFVLPDRTDVKMTVPFMHAYTELLVQTCHKRGAFAMGGMAAQIPSRKDAEANRRRSTPRQGGQGARGGGRLRRDLGRAPGRRRRSRPRRSTRCSATSRTRSTSSAPT